MNRPDTGVDVERARDVLNRGGLVGLPTETVYGLAASIAHEEAIRRVFAVKGRPADHPLIVHVANVEAARSVAGVWPAVAQRLADAFWPGPLTLIVERSDDVPDVVTGGRDTVAVRVPSKDIARELLKLLGQAVVAPSANRFGKVSPTTAGHVADDLGSDVDYILDGGPCDVGVESTIVDCTVDPPQILRPGAITAEQIQGLIGDLAAASGPSRASGMLESHYAPECRILTVETLAEARDLTVDPSTRLIDAASDPEAAARRLYAELRACDRDNIRTAVVVLPNAEGLGAALRDRILKAAFGH